MNQLRSLLVNQSFLSIWMAAIVSGLGDKIAIIALYLTVYHMAGRAVDLGLLAAVQILPAVLIGPLVGLLLDRADRKAIMVVSDLASALVVAALPFATNLLQIYLLAGLLAIGRQVTGPARMAVLPDIVPSVQLEKANGLSMVTRNVVLLVGPALGGGIVALWGIRSAFWLDSATFLASALLLAMRPFVYLQQRPAASTDEDAVRSTLPLRAWRGIRQGVVILWGENRLRFAFLFLAAVTFVTAMQQPLIVLFVKEILLRGDADLGFILSAAGLGGIIGAFAGGLWPAGRRPLRAVTALMAVDGLLLVLFAINRSFALALGIFGLFGAIGTIVQINLATFLQRETPEQHRGRIFGWLGTFAGPLSLFSVFCGPLAADAVGVVSVLALSGLLELVVGLLGWASLPRPLVRSAVATENADPGEEKREMAGEA